MKEKQVIIDTNFFCSYINIDDPKYSEAGELIRDYSGYKFIIPSIVVAELIASGFSIDFIKYCKIYTSKFINISEDDLSFMQKLKPELRRSLKSADCILLAIAKRYNAEILTFDKKLQKVYTQLFD